MSEDLTHLNEKGQVHMVDVGGKEPTDRVAVAEGIVRMSPDTAEILFGGDLPKGDALAAARLAGIMGAKRTSELIPLCHPLALSAVSVDVVAHPDGARVEATVRTTDRTGVEMEAMTAVSVAALTLYDMVKGVERGVEITGIRLLSKSGGRSGEWTR
jgi:cyclic pyranopterin phosphate synthase